MLLRKCKLCKNSFRGRSDKVFCSPKCKAIYHYKLNHVTKTTAQKIDCILHRNRSILLEIMGKNTVQKKIKRILLEQKNFHFKYITHYNINSKGKMYHHVYDFAWMEFSDDEVLIIRR